MSNNYHMVISTQRSFTGTEWPPSSQPQIKQGNYQQHKGTFHYLCKQGLFSGQQLLPVILAVRR